MASFVFSGFVYGLVGISHDSSKIATVLRPLSNAKHYFTKFYIFIFSIEMESNSDESTKFVCLIVEQKDVLTKSRVVELTKRKETAAAEIIKKWSEISGKTLTQAGLYKKINNFNKSRAKLALSSGKQLSDWQSKLLEIVVNKFCLSIFVASTS